MDGLSTDDWTGVDDRDVGWTEMVGLMDGWVVG